MIFLITFSETQFFRKTGFLCRGLLDYFWLGDRTTSKKCDRFFQLSLEKAIALFVLMGKSATGLFWVMRSHYQQKMRSPNLIIE